MTGVVLVQFDPLTYGSVMSIGRVHFSFSSRL